MKRMWKISLVRVIINITIHVVFGILSVNNVITKDSGAKY